MPNKSREAFVEEVKKLKTPLPEWARGVYGYQQDIVVTDGVPGGESRCESLATSQEWDWNWYNTFLSVENGVIDLETPPPTVL